MIRVFGFKWENMNMNFLLSIHVLMRLVVSNISDIPIPSHQIIPPESKPQTPTSWRNIPSTVYKLLWKGRQGWSSHSPSLAQVDEQCTSETLIREVVQKERFYPTCTFLFRTNLPPTLERHAWLGIYIMYNWDKFGTREWVCFFTTLSHEWFDTFL